jgi:hypothetical protein
VGSPDGKSVGNGEGFPVGVSIGDSVVGKGPAGDGDEPGGDPVGEASGAGVAVLSGGPVVGVGPLGDVGDTGVAVPEPGTGASDSPVSGVGYLVGKGDGLSEGTEDTPADGEVGVCVVGVVVTSSPSFSDTSSSVGASVGAPGS